MATESDGRGVIVIPRRDILRGLAGILAAGCAPLIVRAGILMPVRKLFIPTAHDPDTLIRVVNTILSAGIELSVGDHVSFHNGQNWVVSSVLQPSKLFAVNLVNATHPLAFAAFEAADLQL